MTDFARQPLFTRVPPRSAVGAQTAITQGMPQTIRSLPVPIIRNTVVLTVQPPRRTVQQPDSAMLDTPMTLYPSVKVPLTAANIVASANQSFYRRTQQPLYPGRTLANPFASGNGLAVGTGYAGAVGATGPLNLLPRAPVITRVPRSPIAHQYTPLGIAQSIMTAPSVGAGNAAGTGAASGVIQVMIMIPAQTWWMNMNPQAKLIPQMAQDVLQRGASLMLLPPSGGIGNANGIGAAYGQGNTIINAAGNSAGVGTGYGIAIATSLTVGNANGAGTAGATGAARFNAFGASVGVGAAAAVGVGYSLLTGVGTAAGVGAAAAVGTSYTLGSGDGLAAGASTASAVGYAGPVTSAAGLASSVGVATAVGVGITTVTAVGSAAGQGLAAATSNYTFSGAGYSAGQGGALGAGSDATAYAAGFAAGTSNVYGAAWHLTVDARFIAASPYRNWTAIYRPGLAVVTSNKGLAMTDRFPVADPSEVLVLTFDFSAGLNTDEVLTGCSVVISLDNGFGVDPAPQNIMALFTVLNTSVQIQVANMLVDNDYHIHVSVPTNQNRTVVWAKVLPVRGL